MYSKRHIKNGDSDHKKYRKLCEDIIIRRTREMEQGMEVIQDQGKFICLLLFTLRWKLISYPLWKAIDKIY